MAVHAVLWERDTATAAVHCQGCAHACHIGEGKAGRCRVRVNRGGVLYSLSSDHVAAVRLDPVEKKPLYHFLPGTTTLSLGTAGCNMVCAFCQNHSLSQGTLPPFTGPLEAMPPAFPAEVVASALKMGASSISFTYNEPLVSPECILSAAPQAGEAGLSCVLVSNAYASPQSLNLLKPLIHAANFDLKAFTDKFYHTLCSAHLAPVLRTLEKAVAFGWWVEITTLLIPGWNDSDEELTAIARFIKEHLGAHVPWHVSRFHPAFRMVKDVPTPVSSVERAVQTGLAEGLLFVYAGNIPGHEAEHTRCPHCGHVVIHRVGYRVTGETGGRCPRCGQHIQGVWGIA